MNTPSTPVVDGQAPARRIGYLIAFVSILFCCSSMTGIWFVFHKESFEILQTSWHLRSTGVTTTGTVSDVEQHEGTHTYSNSTFTLFVDYVVDGETYTITSNTDYPSRSSSWVGETMPVIYDPADPSIGQIKTFDERWFSPFLDVFPF